MLRLDAELNKDIIMELKKPLGKLYPDFEDAIGEIKSSEFLISVGDATFSNLIEHELFPNIAIIDNLISIAVYADYEKYKKMLADKNLRKHVPIFNINDAERYLDGRGVKWA